MVSYFENIVFEIVVSIDSGGKYIMTITLSLNQEKTGLQFSTNNSDENWDKFQDELLNKIININMRPTLDNSSIILICDEYQDIEELERFLNELAQELEEYIDIQQYKICVNDLLQNRQRQITDEVKNPVASLPEGLRFESYEHKALGNRAFNEFMMLHPEIKDQLLEYGLMTEQKINNNEARYVYVLKISESLCLQPGEIVALAGDFYGMPEAPISKGLNSQEKRERFEAAYHTLFDILRDTEESKELEHIRAEIQTEMNTVVAGVVRKRKTPYEAHADYASKANWHYHRATMHCFFTPWNSHYSDLAFANYDHFHPDAAVVYRIGHKLAIKELAGKNIQEVWSDNTVLGKKEIVQRLQCLVKAFAIELFAAHYLTDIFAAGHLRTPRIELVEYIKNYAGILNGITKFFSEKSAEEAAIKMAGYFAKKMHDEDNRDGIMVTNSMMPVPNHWELLGDGFYFEKKCKSNRDKINEMLLANFDELLIHINVPEITNTSVAQPKKKYAYEKYLPQIDFTASPRTYPLFKIDETTKRLGVRENLSDPYTFKYIYNWSPLKIFCALFLPGLVDNVNLPGKVYAAISKYLQSDNPETEEQLLREADDLKAFIDAINEQYIKEKSVADMNSASMSSISISKDPLETSSADDIELVEVNPGNVSRGMSMS